MTVCLIAVMAPMPAGGDDLPQSDNGLGTSPPPALTVSSSDEDGDDEPAADAGYQPLPLGEPDDDGTGESDTEDENAAEAVSTSTEAFHRSATSNIVLQSSHLPPVTLTYLKHLLLYISANNSRQRALCFWVISLAVNAYFT